jgi:aryl-alcohol dehydrogenase-like predicted oxidoreductase
MYNLAERRWEDTLNWCESNGVGFIPWYPLSAGNLKSQEKLSEVAERYEASEYQIALAWLLQHSPVMLPIPGTSSLAHLEENVAASKINLHDDDVEILNGLAG